ncbi:MAG: GNAT family N-acetyltransferase [Bacteriovoracaceae bacterium]|jgi:[ribosomal protein S5]-alanine N-acetyltransferase|nr:GNAT family N-acetyltransferase [Bacteriovoracaceae bacterium]
MKQEIYLETNRLYIRKITEQDDQYFLRWLTDPEVTTHVGGPRPEKSIKETIDRALKNWAELGFGPGMVISKDEGEVVGVSGISKVDIEGNDEFDLGYLIDKNHWNKGFAFEISSGIVNKASSHNLSALTAMIHPKNTISIRIVDKLGFNFEKSVNQIGGKGVSDPINLYKHKISS